MVREEALEETDGGGNNQRRIPVFGFDHPAAGMRPPRRLQGRGHRCCSTPRRTHAGREWGRAEPAAWPSCRSGVETASEPKIPGVNPGVLLDDGEVRNDDDDAAEALGVQYGPAQGEGHGSKSLAAACGHGEGEERSRRASGLEAVFEDPGAHLLELAFRRSCGEPSNVAEQGVEALISGQGRLNGPAVSRVEAIGIHQATEEHASDEVELPGFVAAGGWDGRGSGGPGGGEWSAVGAGAGGQGVRTSWRKCCWLRRSRNEFPSPAKSGRPA